MIYFRKINRYYYLSLQYTIDAWASWIFIDNTDKVEGGLIVLFFGLIFSVGFPHPP